MLKPAVEVGAGYLAVAGVVHPALLVRLVVVAPTVGDAVAAVADGDAVAVAALVVTGRTAAAVQIHPHFQDLRVI